MIVAIALLALVLCGVVSRLTTDVVLRDALVKTYVYGTYYVVGPAFLAVCLVAIAERIWRYFRG